MNDKTKKIIIGTALTVAVLAAIFTIGFKITHKPAISETDEISSEESEVVAEPKHEEMNTADKKAEHTDKATDNKLVKTGKTDKKNDAKPTVKPADKDNTDSKPAVNSSDKAEASKPDTKPEPVKPTPTPTPKPEPVKPSPKPTPTPQPKPEPTPTVPDTPAPVKPTPKPTPAPTPKPTPAPTPTPKPEEHVHNWADMYERKAEQVWVVDSPAWDEEVCETIGYHDVCNGCGCDLTSMDWETRSIHLADCGGSYHNEPIYNKYIVHHDETGHYETKYNTVVVGRECLTCGKQEYY